AKTLACRSEYVSIYFGDETAKPCGICDNCLNTKATSLTTEEFDNITKQITERISNRGITAIQLISELKNIKKEKTWKVLEFLQAENKVVFDNKGVLKLKG
ncbi:MAG: RecQ family zinc-binding domain-containing protein, partial [Flavisolibacter sp.]